MFYDVYWTEAEWASNPNGNSLDHIPKVSHVPNINSGGFRSIKVLKHWGTETMSTVL